MRAHGWERRLGKRFALVIGAAALGAAVIAAGASANFRSVDDPRGDTGCKSESGSCSDSQKRNADIVRATAGHGKNGRLKHTIRVVGKFQGGEIQFNTDLSNRSPEWILDLHRGHRHRIRTPLDAMSIGRARCDFHRHSVEISFSKRSIGNPHRYGWRAFARSDGVTDVVPRREDYIQHRLG